MSEPWLQTEGAAGASGEPTSESGVYTQQRCSSVLLFSLLPSQLSPSLARFCNTCNKLTDTPESTTPPNTKKTGQSHGQCGPHKNKIFGGHLHSYVKQQISIQAFPTRASGIPPTRELMLHPAFLLVPQMRTTDKQDPYLHLRRFSDASFPAIQALRTCSKHQTCLISRLPGLEEPPGSPKKRQKKKVDLVECLNPRQALNVIGMVSFFTRYSPV